MAGPAVIPPDTLAVLTFSMPGTNTRGVGQGGPITVSGLNPATGVAAGGTVVTFTGTGFAGETPAVTFGGAAGTAVNVVDATHFTATTPAHAAGAVDVKVTAPTELLLRGAFTYT